MSQWRKLHIKILLSKECNDMPNDFTRLLWILLLLVLDKEGRGIYNAKWINSNCFPVREDATQEKIVAAMDWLKARQMIIPYDVNGWTYFFVPTWHVYQKTDREAASTLPPPPDELVAIYSRGTPDECTTNSRVTHDQLMSSSRTEKEEEIETEEMKKKRKDICNTDAEVLKVLTNVTGFLTFPSMRREESTNIIRTLMGNHGQDTSEYLKPFFIEWTKRGYRKTNLSWLDWAITGEIPPLTEKKNEQLQKDFTKGYKQA